MFEHGPARDMALQGHQFEIYDQLTKADHDEEATWKPAPKRRFLGTTLHPRALAGSGRHGLMRKLVH